MKGSHKRGSDERWVSGRGGIGRGARNTPGGRGWSPENPPRDGPTTPPPAVGGMGDPPPGNDPAPVHPSGDTIAVGDSGVEGSGSDKELWRPKFRLGSASSAKKPPTTPSPSRSDEDWQGTPSPSRPGKDRWGAALRSEGDWRHRRNLSLTPPHPTCDRNSSATPPDPKSRSDGDWRVRSASSTPSHPTLSDRSSSGTPPYGSRSDVADPKSRSDGDWRVRSASSTPSHPTLSDRSSSGTPPYGSRSDVESWRKKEIDPPTPLKVTGWPQRPVPELIVALMSPGILGRAPLPIREKLLKQDSSLYTEPAAHVEPSTLQSSSDHYDAAEGDPEDGQYDAAQGEGTPEEVLSMWQDAVEAMWQDAVVEFLNVYKHPGHQYEFYLAQLGMAKLLGKFDITVEFDHLKAWNKKLAYIICNGQGRDDQWLKQALSLFLNGHGVDVDAEDVNIFFRNMPTRLKIGRDIFSASGDLVIAVTLFNGRERAITSSYCCAQILDATISGLLARLSCGLSWCGKLTIEDIEFTEVNGVLRATIKREPEIHQGATSEDQVLDVHSLWPMIEPVVTWRGLLPLYFLELKDDLTCATAEEVTQPWFHEYIAYHPSLMPSMGRRNFETGLYQTVNSLTSDEILALNGVLTLQPMPSDWRKLVWDDKYLKVNFHHGNPWASQDSREWIVKGQVATAGSVQVRNIEGTETAGQQKAAADGAYHKGTATEIVPGQHTGIAKHCMVVDDASHQDKKEGIIKENVSAGGAAHDGGIEEHTETPGQQKAAADNAYQDRTALEIGPGQQKEMAEHQMTDYDASEDENVEKVVSGKESSVTTKGDDRVLEGVSGQDTMGNSEQKDLMERGRYKNTIRGLIEFKRHVHNHPPVKSDDIDESEIFLSDICCRSLPKVLREFLKNRRMTGKFESIWSAYKTSKQDPRRLTTPTNSPISDLTKKGKAEVW